MGLTFGRDGLRFARSDSYGASFGQVRSRPPHFDLHVSVALVHVVLHLPKIKDRRWTTKTKAKSIQTFLKTEPIVFSRRNSLGVTFAAAGCPLRGNSTPVRHHPRCDTSH